MHPDKTGKKDNKEFKELLNAYKVTLKALEEILECDENDKGELFTFFEKHNIATEKSKSWTIVVEKDK